MNLLYFFGFTIFTASFGLSTSVTRLQFVFKMFLRFFKEPAEIVCPFFEAFSGGFILLELEVFFL